MGTKDVKTASLNFKKDQQYNIELRMCNKAFSSQAPPINCRGGLKLGASKKMNAVQDEIKLAVAVASQVDGERSFVNTYNLFRLNQTTLSSGCSCRRIERRVSILYIKLAIFISQLF